MNSCSYQAGGVLARSTGAEGGQEEDVGGSDHQEVTMAGWWSWGGGASSLVVASGQVRGLTVQRVKTVSFTPISKLSL